MTDKLKECIRKVNPMTEIKISKMTWLIKSHAHWNYFEASGHALIALETTGAIPTTKELENTIKASEQNARDELYHTILEANNTITKLLTTPATRSQDNR